MELVHKAEKALEGPFSSLPPLPKEAKKGLADIWPWLALAAAVLQLLAARFLYNWANSVDTTPRVFGLNSINEGLTLWVWIAVIVLVVCAVILLLAFPKLQKKQKAGWDLLLLAGLVNIVYGVVSLFINGRGGMGTLLWALIGSAIGFYLLFQVREFFGGKAVTPKQ